MTKDEVLAILQSQNPDTDVVFIGSGSDSDAYRAGTRIIRIPHAGSVDIYLREAAICHAIRPFISIPIPDITVHSDGDFMYVEHEMITGHKWSWHKFIWQPWRQKNLGKSIARFMAEMHTIDVSRVACATGPSMPYMEFDDVAPFISEILSPRQMQFLRKNYERILAHPVAKSDMVLTHLGIKGPNSVIDDTGALSGVFDFCNAGIYERWRDMVLIRMLAPYGLWRVFAREYERLTGVRIDVGRIVDLMKIEFLWSKRWIGADGKIHPAGRYFLAKNVGACMARFHHLPMIFKWMWVKRG